jgi:hypothetical protein
MEAAKVPASLVVCGFLVASTTFKSACECCAVLSKRKAGSFCVVPRWMRQRARRDAWRAGLLVARSGRISIKGRENKVPRSSPKMGSRVKKLRLSEINCISFAGTSFMVNRAGGLWMSCGVVDFALPTFPLASRSALLDPAVVLGLGR